MTKSVFYSAIFLAMISWAFVSEAQQQLPPQQQQQQWSSAPAVPAPVQMNWGSLICVQDNPTSIKNYYVRDFEGTIYQMNNQQWDCEKQASIKKFQIMHCTCVLKIAEMSINSAANVTSIDRTKKEAQEFDAANGQVFERMNVAQDAQGAIQAPAEEVQDEALRPQQSPDRRDEQRVNRR